MYSLDGTGIMNLRSPVAGTLSTTVITSVKHLVPKDTENDLARIRVIHVHRICQQSELGGNNIAHQPTPTCGWGGVRVVDGVVIQQ